MTPDQKAKAIKVMRLVEAVIELIEGSKHGISGGELYAHMMSAMTLEQFEQFMAFIVQTGRVKVSNHLYTGAKSCG